MKRPRIENYIVVVNSEKYANLKGVDYIKYCWDLIEYIDFLEAGLAEIQNSV